MATLKHISSKNSNYTAIEAYLVYQHDEFTGKQLLDEHGKPKLRESYLLDTLECGDFSFATPACWQTASTARIPSMVISRAINISSALTPEMQRQRLDHGKGTGTWLKFWGQS